MEQAAFSDPALTYDPDTYGSRAWPCWPAIRPASLRAQPFRRGQLLFGEEHVRVVAAIREQEIGHSVPVVSPGEVLM